MHGIAQACRHLLAGGECLIEEPFLTELDRVVLGDGTDVCPGQLVEFLGLQQSNYLAEGTDGDISLQSVKVCQQARHRAISLNKAVIMSLDVVSHDVLRGGIVPPVTPLRVVPEQPAAHESCL